MLIKKSEKSGRNLRSENMCSIKMRVWDPQEAEAKHH
jgi:hypothetical protein